VEGIVKGTARHALFLALVCALIFQPVRAESFKSAKLLPVANGSSYVLTADVNGDGKLDLVFLTAPTPVGSTIDVALGSGDGTFGAPQAIPSLPSGTGLLGSFSIADVNHDGKPDLVVGVFVFVNPVALHSFLAVYIGNGDGTFQTPLLSAGPTGNSVDVALSGKMGIGDFDGDGMVDLVVADQANNTLSFLKGDNQGHFSLRNTFSDMDNPVRVYAVDLNGDGRLDFVALYGNAAAVAVYMGNGDGTFQPKAIYTGPNNTRSVVVQDMNNDGHPDLVFAGFLDTVDILLNRGDGTFSNTSAGGTTYAGVNPQVVAVQDFDGDGVLDIAVLSWNGLGILHGLGNLSYASVKQYPASNVDLLQSPLVVGDLDGDGHTDFGIPSSDGLVLMRGRADGTFESADAYDIGNQVSGLAEGDFNGDKIPDLAVGASGFTPRILLGKGDGTFTITADANQPVPTSGFSTSIFALDFNGDHKVDLLTKEDREVTSFLSLGNGDGTFAAPTSFAPSGLQVDFVVQDLNNDGIPDLLTVNDQTLTAYIGHADQTYTQVVSTLSTGVFGNLVFADVNQDGKVDIVFNNYFGGPPIGSKIVIALGNGDGTFTERATYDVTESAPATAVADVDGDGHMDIIRASGIGVATTPNQQQGGAGLQVLYGHGDGTFEAPVNVQTPHLVNLIASADLNMDGVADLVLSDGLVVTVMNGAANRTFGAPHDYLAGGSPSSPIIMDLNGDGGPDLVFANADVNTISTATVLLNLGVTKGTLTANPNPAIYGQPISLTASFTPTVAGVPTGTVSFAVGGNALGNAPLQAGVASLTGPALAPVGTETVKANWMGDDTFNAHALSTTITVTKADSSVTLSPAPAVAVVGQKVTLTALVSPQFSGVPSGRVNFQPSTGAASSVNVDAKGSATLVVDTSKLALGNYSYTATYSGDGNFNSSSTGSATQFVVTDFHVTASPVAVTVSAGGTGTVNVSVVTTTGFNGSVDLSCTGLPAEVQCSFAPASVSLGNASSGASVMTIMTSGAGATVREFGRWKPGAPTGPAGVVFGFVTALVGLAIFAIGEDLRRRAVALLRAIAAVAVICVGCAFAGCGGGGSGGMKPMPVTYAVQVVATVHRSSPAIARTASVSVTVQP
jgi:hypothetical protein